MASSLAWWNGGAYAEDITGPVVRRNPSVPFLSSNADALGRQSRRYIGCQPKCMGMITCRNWLSPTGRITPGLVSEVVSRATFGVLITSNTSRR